MAKIDLKTVGTFVGGVLFGTAGLKILGSDDAKRYIPTAQLQVCVRKTVL